MKLFRIILAISFFSSLIAFANITRDQEFIINHSSASSFKAQTGSLLNLTKGTLVAKYNFATQGGKSTADIDLLTDNLDLTKKAKLPAKAVVTNVWVESVTLPVATNGAAATIAIRVNGAADLVPATTVAAWPGANTFSQGTPTGATTTFVRLNFANDSTVKMRLATQSLTAGKFDVVLEYVIGD